MARKVYIKTLGCKVNSFDAQALETRFEKNGYHMAASPKEADITVINTCSVTETATKEARYLLRRFRRENPASLQVVTGCYAQIDSARLSQMAEVDMVIPNESKDRLVEFLDGSDQKIDPTTKMPQGLTPVVDNKQVHFKTASVLFDQPAKTQTRTFFKVQDGCNGFCTYCQIPYARGASRSVPKDAILSQIKARLSSAPIGELVLTGIHLGDYGDDLTPASSLVELLGELIQLPELGRIRLSSLEPSEVTPPLIGLMAQHRERFCDHFHLPLQSGSDRILKLMRRQYTKARYMESVQMIRQAFPLVHISADVIPGFPGETEEEFQETKLFIEECQMGSLHVFPYSQRPNTAALRLPGHLDASVIKRRADELRGLSRTLSDGYLRSFLGQTREVLWEEDRDSLGRRLGKTANYIKVATSLEAEPGHRTLALLRGFCGEGVLLGVPIEKV
jgi:threonylcarbamoyladenosine tRNA methylthiotransferase MtaB